MEFLEKEVRFDEFCFRCQFKDIDEGENPCNECLHHPVNLHSRIPTEFKEAKNASANKKISSNRS